MDESDRDDAEIQGEFDPVAFSSRALGGPWFLRNARKCVTVISVTDYRLLIKHTDISPGDLMLLHNNPRGAWGMLCALMGSEKHGDFIVPGGTLMLRPSLSSLADSRSSTT